MIVPVLLSANLNAVSLETIDVPAAIAGAHQTSMVEATASPAHAAPQPGAIALTAETATSEPMPLPSTDLPMAVESPTSAIAAAEAIDAAPMAAPLPPLTGALLPQTNHQAAPAEVILGLLSEPSEPAVAGPEKLPPEELPSVPAAIPLGPRSVDVTYQQLKRQHHKLRNY
jgi:hypothetical protein